MNKIMFVLPILSLGMIVSCNNPTPSPTPTPTVYKVNETEWNEAIENIVHVKKKNFLNYKAEGDLRNYKLNKDTHYKSLKYIEVNETENISKRRDEIYDKIFDNWVLSSAYDYTSLKLENYHDLYGVHRVNHLYLTEQTHRLFEFHLSDRIEVFDRILDLYGNYQSFNYSDGHYISKTEGIGYRFNIDITFNSKKLIDKLNIDYLLQSGEDGIAMNGNLKFTYDVSTLSKKDLPDDYNTLMEKKMNDVTVVETLIGGLKEITSQISITTDVNLFKITCNTSECSKGEISYFDKTHSDRHIYPFSYLNKSTAIIKDGDKYTILNKGSQEGEGDYWYIDPNPENEYCYEKLILKEPLKKDQILYLAYEGAAGYHSPDCYCRFVYAE